MRSLLWWRMPKTLRSPAQQRLLVLIKNARRNAGLTQAEVAERLGRPQSYVAKVEGGERRLDVVEFVLLMKALDAEMGIVFNEVAEAAKQ